jgi:hypothetical protein
MQGQTRPVKSVIQEINFFGQILSADLTSCATRSKLTASVNVGRETSMNCLTQYDRRVIRIISAAEFFDPNQPQEFDPSELLRQPNMGVVLGSHSIAGQLI